MFLETKDAFRQKLLINVDLVEAVLEQQDGDVFIYMKSGHHYKVSKKVFEELKGCVTVKDYD